MRTNLEWMEWLHATFIFAMLIPLVCAVGNLQVQDGAALFYLKCLLVALPVSLTGIVARKAETLLGYLLMCAAVFAVMYGLVAGLPQLLGQQALSGGAQVCYRVGMLTETAALAALRFADRLRRNRYVRIKEENPLEEYAESFLNRPSLGMTWYFVVMYLFGLLLASKLLCDLALFSVLVYGGVAMAYTFFNTTAHYLTLNKRTKGIPGKRLYAVSGGMLGLFAGLLLAAVWPSFLLTDARSYTDVREWFQDMPMEPPVYEGGEMQAADADMEGLAEMFPEGAGEPSPIWEILANAVAFVGMAVFVFSIAAAVKRVFRDFRKAVDENGDKVEDLSVSERVWTIDAAEKNGEKNRVRRLYKKTVRKHRKDRPAIYESPSEIEERAGLLQDETMQSLHAAYEQVRYGR